MVMWNIHRISIIFCQKSGKKNQVRLIKKTVSKDERAWFFSFTEKRAKTVSERIFHAGENTRVFISTNLILA
jgi:hypothetical protein